METGCYIDCHNGHYAIPSVIELAQNYGYILGPFAEYVLDNYNDHYHEDEYPTSALDELATSAIEWLNSSYSTREIQGQNCPPFRPDGYYWDWNDGDFGLYKEEDE